MKRLLLAVPVLLLASCGVRENAQSAPDGDVARLSSRDVVGAVSEWANGRRVQEQQVNETAAINCRAAAYRDFDALPKGAQSDRRLEAALRECRVDVASAPATGCVEAAAAYIGQGVWQCGAVRFDETTGRVWFARS